MNINASKVFGGAIVGFCGVILLLLKRTRKIIKDEQASWSDEERELMKYDFDDAKDIISHMWKLGQKYMEEHPEEDYDWYFNK